MAESARLAGMGVETGDSEHRRGDAEILPQRRRGYPAGFDDRCRGQAFDRPPQSQMDRDRDDPQLRADQHHYRRRSLAAEFGQIFGMTGMTEAGAIKAVLVDRVGHEG